MGVNAFQEIQEESIPLILMCKYCDNCCSTPVEATNAEESGIAELLLPEKMVRWLRTNLCPTCYSKRVPKTLQFLSKFADVTPIEIEKEDLPYFNLLFPQRNAKHFRLLLNIDEMQIVKNSNLRWKELKE